MHHRDESHRAAGWLHTRREDHAIPRGHVHRSSRDTRLQDQSEETRHPHRRGCSPRGSPRIVRERYAKAITHYESALGGGDPAGLHHAMGLAAMSTTSADTRTETGCSLGNAEATAAPSRSVREAERLAHPLAAGTPRTIDGAHHKGAASPRSPVKLHLKTEIVGGRPSRRDVSSPFRPARVSDRSLGRGSAAAQRQRFRLVTDAPLWCSGQPHCPQLHAASGALWMRRDDALVDRGVGRRASRGQRMRPQG